MKKFVVILMMVVILTLSLGMAHAETHMVTVKWSEDQNCKIDEIGDEHYYVFVTRDNCDYTVTREVSRTVWYELLAEEQRDEEVYNNHWYVKTCRWCKGAAIDVADFVIFWN